MNLFTWIGSIGLFSRRKTEREDTCEQVFEEHNLLCRFVLDGFGRKVGESIAIDEDVLIIKNGKTFLGVPLKHVEEKEKTLLVRGLLDQDKARELGEKWRKAAFDEMKQEIEKNGI